MTDDEAFWLSLEESTATLDIEALVDRLQPLTVGMALTTPFLDAKEFFYRARRLGQNGFTKDQPIRIEDIKYPPRKIAPLGRANAAGDPVFYCSIGKEALFYELGAFQSGDELVVTFWQSTARMLLNNIGYTQFVFDALGARRECPRWSASSNGKHATMELPVADHARIQEAIRSDRNNALRERLSRYFMRDVPANEQHRYKLTAAIAQCHLGTIANSTEHFAGILYPSLRMWANADNVALLPWFVDSHLTFKKALHVRVDKWSNKEVSITNVDAATELLPDGSLRWLGRLPNWTIPGGTAAKVMLKGGRDHHGDYSRDSNGEVCHWTVVDDATGLPVESR